MKNHHKRMISARVSFLSLSLLLCLTGRAAFSQTSTFTYQGRLTDGGPAATGNYDFRFRLFDSASGGTQLGPLNALGNVTVTNGVFTVQLSFGNPLAFPDNFSGADRYLEIAVRQASQDPLAPFTTLSPRQQITSSPYAIRSASTGTADNAVNATALGGVAANQFVTTSDPRLSDPRPPTAGNSNYVQNTTVAQAASNFNISGNGTAGGMLSGNVVNSAVEYDIAGSRVLSAGGAGNTFLGLGVAPANIGFANSFFGSSAGAANTRGANNSFFGSNAGTANTGDPSIQALGSGNAFFGSNAGVSNTLGFANSFVGNSAGNKNTSGASNTFVGSAAGFNNTDGSNNTYLGSDAGGTSPSLVNATAIGAGASVSTSNTMVLGTGSITVQVPGNLNVTGTLTGSGLNLSNLNAGNIASGVVPIAHGGTGSPTQNFVDLTTNQTIGGNKTFNSAVDTNAQYNIGGQRVLGVASDNLFAGLHAGQSNSGFSNSFFGYSAGTANSDGANNAFFGSSAGFSNSTGTNNAFFGKAAGQNNTVAGGNSFFGAAAGFSNTTAHDNSFFGNSGGYSNTTGVNNSFFGSSAGYNNTTGDSNAFFGHATGVSNTEGAANAFFGSGAGALNTTGAENSFFGTGAGQSTTTGGANTFIGFTAGNGNVTGNNNIVIGINAGISMGPDGHGNIYISNAGNNESDTIRVGNFQTRTFIAGINGVVVAGAPVIVNANGQLGTTLSSRRYKQNIRDMGVQSNDLLRLRPVTFQYKPEYSAEPQTLQYGLIAEEVAKIYPNLVAYGKDGKPYTVLYHLLTPMLLNEVQKQESSIKHQQAQIEEQQERLAEQRALVTSQQEEIKQQQKMVNDLRKLVCLSHPHARACR